MVGLALAVTNAALDVDCGSARSDGGMGLRSPPFTVTPF